MLKRENILKRKMNTKKKEMSGFFYLLCKHFPKVVKEHRMLALALLFVYIIPLKERTKLK